MLKHINKKSENEKEGEREAEKERERDWGEREKEGECNRVCVLIPLRHTGYLNSYIKPLNSDC